MIAAEVFNLLYWCCKSFSVGLILGITNTNKLYSFIENEAEQVNNVSDQKASPVNLVYDLR